MPRIARQITRWSEKEIAQFLKKTRTIYRQSGLSIRVAPQSGTIGRVLIVTPAKSGIAPLRNRVRRQLKAIFYERKLYEHGHDWLFYISKTSLLSFPVLNNAINICLAGLSSVPSSA